MINAKNPDIMNEHSSNSTHIPGVICRHFGSVMPSSAIVAVYLFGSQLHADCKKTSDIDIAVLFDEGAYKADPIRTSAPAYMAAAQTGLAAGCETDVTLSMK